MIRVMKRWPRLLESLCSGLSLRTRSVCCFVLALARVMEEASDAL